jgi:hypothetical protein
VTNRSILIFLALALAPAPAAAQFTTFIPPRDRVADSIRTVTLEEERLAADSAARATVADMRTWVDSAAGVAVPPPASRDSAIAAGTTRFADGARAPNTATTLPLLLMLGGVLMGLGALLLRPAPPARAPVRTRDRA